MDKATLQQHLVPLDTTTPPPFFIFDANTHEQFSSLNYAKLSQFLSQDLFRMGRHLILDWTRCFSHPLIFDVDIKGGEGKNTYAVLMRYFDAVFLNALQQHLECLDDLTILLSMRRHQTGGLHVHILDVELAHDDYVSLCNRMRSQCQYQEGKFCVTLDCPSSMSLVACDKPKGQGGLYVPTCLLGVQFRENGAVWQEVGKVLFSCDHVGLYDRIVSSPERMMELAARYMSPVPSDQDVTLVEFETEIFPDYKEEGVGHFTYRGRMHTLVKEEDDLSVHGVTCPYKRFSFGSFCYRFFENKSNSLRSVYSSNRVLNTWYKRFLSKADTGLFQAVDAELREQCLNLEDEPSPLSAILSSPECVLPAFYALCRVLRHEPDAIAEEMYRLWPHVRKFSTRLPPAVASVTMDTLLYLGIRTTVSTSASWAGMYGMKNPRMKEDLHLFQKCCFPIVNAKGGQYYKWCPDGERWQQSLDTECDARKIAQSVNRFYQDINHGEYVVNGISASDVLIQLECSKVLEGNKRDDTIGMHVPEYYFF